MQPYLGLDRPGFLALILVALLAPIWRRARRHDRAFAQALALLLLLHGLAWLRAGPALPLHAACDALGLALIGTMALRSRPFYPLAITAALLVAFLARTMGALGPGAMEPGARLLAGIGDFGMVAAFGIGASLRLLRQANRLTPPTNVDRDCEPSQARLSQQKQGGPS